MENFTGKSLLNRIAIGKIYLYQKQEYNVEKHNISDIDTEKKRFHKARELAMEELKSLYDKAMKEIGEAEAQIFEVHRMMLEDLDFIEGTEQTIETEKVNAEYAVHQAGTALSQMLASMDDDYMKERAIDVLDITKRVIRKLSGMEEGKFVTEEPVIVVAEDLTPSETMQMDQTKILAFVIQKGSSNSHTAILARTMNIPALVKSDIILKQEYQGRNAIVDGTSGNFYIDPSEEILNEMLHKKEQIEQIDSELKKLIGQETVTTNGHKIHLYANIGNVDDTEKALENDAEGIGLFRSEFLFIGKETFPTEEEQFQAYKAVLEKMSDKKVVIRTLDIGADKKADYFQLKQEDNPALGYRAIRICLTQPEIFITQLRALYRASAYGSLSIMFPMIISLEEVLEIKRIVKNVTDELAKEQIPMGNVDLGIMIETPAAALISDDLAKEVQFFSIGSNDLTQYTLAIDRQNEKLESMCDTHHKAIMKLIQMTIENGHKEGIWVGICGELASDTTVTETFIHMGVDELSVSASQILKVRKKIREVVF